MYEVGVQLYVGFSRVFDVIYAAGHAKPIWIGRVRQFPPFQDERSFYGGGTAVVRTSNPYGLLGNLKRTIITIRKYNNMGTRQR